MQKDKIIKSLGYVPGLDGLRALAIVLVMLAHANFQLFENGGVGVPVFFALSGFLITSLLLKEFDESNTLSFKAFYIRRTFRLFPALYTVLLFTLIYALVFNPSMFDPILSEIIAAGLYLYNLSWVWGVKEVMLYHTWSLGVEEQFYLIWPGLFFLFLKYENLNRASIFLIVFILFFGITHSFDLFANNRSYQMVSSVISESIFLGCLIAILRWKGMTQFKIPVFIAVLCLIAIIIIGILPHKTFEPFKPNGLAGIFAVIIILYLINSPEGLFSQLFTNKVAVFIGKISYGLYLWHLPIFKIFAFHSTLPPRVSFIGKFIVSFLFAVASWLLFEKRATVLGHRISKKILGSTK